MAKTKEEKPKEEIKTVIGVSEAEKLREEGWKFISATLTSKGKEYKFKKG